MPEGTALLISNASFLQAGGGGVQWCTREYLATLQAAFNSVSTIHFEIDRRPISRICRFLFPSPFEHLHHPHLIDKIISKASSQNAEWIFLNNMDAAVLAPKLRAANRSLKIAYLSHGVELTDVVNNLRLTKDSISSLDRSSQWLGDLIKLEISIRKAVNAVICISEEDKIFEQWLGSTHTLFIPRQIPINTLNIQPVAGRIGTVSTLNHGPNLEGIRQLAKELDQLSNIELRLVGGPESIGIELESSYRSIKYIGRLSDSALETEASTWNAFINPIFCQARGASTKVATALGWGLPVLTTPQGARGYRWNHECLPVFNSPELLAHACSQLLDFGNQDAARANANAVADLAPSPEDTAQMLNSFLNF